MDFDLDGYSGLVDKASDTRKHINTVLHKRYSVIKRIYEHVVPKSTGGDFKAAVDMIYYDGGYPSASSPPRAESVAKRIASTLFLLEVMGDKCLVNQLEKFGVTVTLDQSKAIKDETISHQSEIQCLKDWTGVMGQIPMPKTAHAIISRLKSAALDLQEEICCKADEIKIDAASEAQVYGIKKAGFIQAVNIGAVRKSRPEKRFRKVLAGALDEADNLKLALCPYDEDGTRVSTVTVGKKQSIINDIVDTIISIGCPTDRALVGAEKAVDLLGLDADRGSLIAMALTEAK